MTRDLLALTVVALATGLGACAGGSTHSAEPTPVDASSSPATVTSTANGAASSRISRRPDEPKTDADGDEDSKGGSRYDSDDRDVLHFGHAAGTADARAITALIRRYYAAGAAADGARACRLVYSLTAESIVEQYGGSAGRSELPGSTCAVVVSKLFKHHESELAADASTLHIAGVRVDGDRGVAMMRFGHAREGHLLIHRERGAWKTEMIFDVRMP